MTEPPYAVAHVDEIPRRGGRSAIREHFGIEAFGVNTFRGDEAGGQVIGEHTEVGSTTKSHEELYLVMSGHATFTVGGEQVDAPVGTLVFVRDPDVRRGAVAREAGTTVLVIGAPRGEPFTVSPWEAASGFWPFYEAGDYDGAARYLEEALERHPGNANVLYNLACMESLGGRAEQALEHLRAAVAADENFRDYARGDSDYDPIREHPAFAEITGGVGRNGS